MKLYYYQVPGGNFGDDLNAWLWDALLPGWRAWPADATLVGVGTLLSPILPPGRKLVLGSGAGYGAHPDVGDAAEWDIRAVRGPGTARVLGLPAEAAIVDPAVMLPDLPAFAAVPKSGERVFVPHHTSAGKYDWERICAGTGIVPLDPRGHDPHAVITRIAGARSVIAESMHGAIIADAFRVPWQAVAITKTFNDFKWRDWADSLEIDLDITRFYARLRWLAELRSRRARRQPRRATVRSATPAAAHGGDNGFSPLVERLLSVLARRTLKSLNERECQLSDPAVLADRKARFRAVLDDVRRDYGG